MSKSFSLVLLFLLLFQAPIFASNKGCLDRYNQNFSKTPVVDTKSLTSLYNEGEQVSIRRSNGEISLVTIGSIDTQGIATVNWIENGKPLQKRVRLESIIHKQSPLGLEMSGESNYDNFRIAFNSRIITEENLYVSVKAYGTRLSAKIIKISHNGVTVQVPNSDNALEELVLTGEELNQIRVSSSSKRVFDSLEKEENQPIAQKSELTYHTRRGQVIHIDLESEDLQNWIKKASSIIKQRIGIPTNSGKILSPEERIKVYRVWLREVVSQVEDQNELSYSSDLKQLLERNNGQLALSEILNKKFATCRELSLFGSLVFSQFGISSKVVTGNVKTMSQGRSSGHAWIQVYDIWGNPLEIIDSNHTKSFHHNLTEYNRRVQGAEILSETSLEKN